MGTPATVILPAERCPSITAGLFAGLQYACLIAIFLMHPVLLAQAAGASTTAASSMVSLTLIALAVGALLQVFVTGPVGSGFLCPPAPTPIYLVPSLVAVRVGGLPLVFGMIVAAGLFQVLLSRTLMRMRPLLPPEIMGLVALVVAVSVGIIGLRTLVGAQGVMPATPAAISVALAAIGVMVGLVVWGRGLPRILCVLAGMVCGYGVTLIAGLPSNPDQSRFDAAPFFAVPSLDHLGFAFAWGSVVPFAVAAIAATLKTASNVAVLQLATDEHWSRVDFRPISGGVLADGLGNVIAGAIGSHGISSSSPATGLSVATGVHSRRIALAIAGVFMVLAFLPKATMALMLVPRPVAVAALLFTGAFVVASGIELMTHRPIDARRGIVIGTGIISGLAVEIFPGMVAALPAGMRSLLGHSLVFGTGVALVLNLLLSPGSPRRHSLLIPYQPSDSRAIEDLMLRQGRAWGVRRDVVDRAAFAVQQSVQTILDHRVATGPFEIHATFDDFGLEVTVTHEGERLEVPVVRPSNEEVLDDRAGQRRLAGFLILRLADRVTTSAAGVRTTVHMRFDC
jgi:xanthine permease XanP